MSKTDKKPEISLKDKIAKNNAIVLFYASWYPFSLLSHRESCLFSKNTQKATLKNA